MTDLEACLLCSFCSLSLCPDRKLLKGGRAYSGLQFEEMHPVMEGKQEHRSSGHMTSPVKNRK